MLAFDYTLNTPKQIAEYVGKEVVKWAKVVKEARAPTGPKKPMTFGNFEIVSNQLQEKWKCGINCLNRD